MFFKCLIELCSEVISSGLFFDGRFFISDSVLLFVIGLFRYSISSGFNLGRLIFLGIYPNFWYFIVHNRLMSLYISVVPLAMFPPSFIVLLI
jgi:hypothetical protein